MLVWFSLWVRSFYNWLLYGFGTDTQFKKIVEAMLSTASARIEPTLHPRQDPTRPETQTPIGNA